MPLVGFIASLGIVFVINVVCFCGISIGTFNFNGYVGESAKCFSVQSVDVFD